MTTYNFARGHPNRSLVPVEEIKSLFARLGRVNDVGNQLQRALNYGHVPGEPELLQELMNFLNRQCENDDFGLDDSSDTRTNPHLPRACIDHLFMTGGVSHGIELLTAVATQPGDLVWVEMPTYFLVAGIFKSHGLEIDALPHCQGRVDVDKLEQQLESGARPRMIYIIPTHQNPTGRTMSCQDRIRIARLARKFQILVIADEVYHLLDWHGRRPARMALLDSVLAENEPVVASAQPPKLLHGCVSVSSFTKIYGPGIRLGWVEASSQHVIQSLSNYGYIQSQGGVAPLMGELMRTALQDTQVDQVLDKLCNAYQRRSRLLYKILSREPRIQMPYGQPCGGYFLWIQFPASIGSVASLVEYMAPEIKLLPGPQCNAVPSAGENDMLSLSARLCFADMDETDLENGAQLLITKFRAFMETLERKSLPVDRDS